MNGPRRPYLSGGIAGNPHHGAHLRHTVVSLGPCFWLDPLVSLGPRSLGPCSRSAFARSVRPRFHSAARSGAHTRSAYTRSAHNPCARVMSTAHDATRTAFPPSANSAGRPCAGSPTHRRLARSHIHCSQCSARSKRDTRPRPSSAARLRAARIAGPGPRSECWFERTVCGSRISGPTCAHEETR